MADKFTLAPMGYLHDGETGAVDWLARQLKFEGSVQVTRKSPKPFDLVVRATYYAPYYGPVEKTYWLPAACVEVWAATSWSKFFARPKSDTGFVDLPDRTTVWSDFTAVVAAASSK